MNDIQVQVSRRVEFFWRQRRLLLAVVMVGAVLSALSATNIKTHVILSDLFPQDHPYLALHKRFSQVFGGGGTSLVIALRACRGDIFNLPMLGKIRDLTREIELWDEIYRVQTVSIASNATKVVKTKARGEIAFEALMFPDIPANEAEIQLLKKNIFSNPAYDGTLVSRDGSAALVLTEMRETVSYERIFQKLQDVVRRYSDENTSVHIVGFPMLMGWIYSHKPQLYQVFAISAVLMAALLYLSFRNFVGMIVPAAMSAICTAFGLGFIAWTGVNFSPLQFVLAFLVVSRMLSNAVQITHRYIEEYRVSLSKETAAKRTMQTMSIPNAAAVATDAAGFLVLGIADIRLMKQVAILMSFWMITILLEGTVVPLLCSLLPLKAAEPSGGQRKDRSEWLVSLSRFSITVGRYPIVLLALATAAYGFWQVSSLKVGDPTPGSPILWERHPYNQDQVFFNQNFRASSETFSLYFDGAPESVYDPAVLMTFELFSQHMAQSLPDIYMSSSSLANLMKMLNCTFHEGDPVWYEVPRDREKLTGMMALLRSSAGMAGLQRYVDPEQSRAQITLFFADHTSDNLKRIRDAAYGFFQDHPVKTETGEFKLAGGRIGMEIALNEEMKKTHLLLDSLVLGAIFCMCSLSFRSLVAGAMLSLPLVLSNLIAFGYMAYAGIGLTTATLPCSAVGVGVGVDFAIYLYSRAVEEYPQTRQYTETILRAVRTAGFGIFLTALTLILPILSWYPLSALKFQAQMGLLLAILLFSNMIMAFTIHPLLLSWLRPSFVRSREASRISVAEPLAREN